MPESLLQHYRSWFPFATEHTESDLLWVSRQSLEPWKLSLRHRLSSLQHTTCSCLFWRFLRYSDETPPQQWENHASVAYCRHLSWTRILWSLLIPSSDQGIARCKSWIFLVHLCDWKVFLCSLSQELSCSQRWFCPCYLRIDWALLSRHW